MKKPILIGGCGSSGTTLLRKILNAHPRIACGTEMSVFDRPLFYTESIEYLYTLWRAQDFDPVDSGCVFPLRINSKYGDRSYCGLLHENAVGRYHSHDFVNELFARCESIPEFFDLFFSGWAEKEGKSRWAEKTPNNIFCMDRWLEAYPDGQAVVLIRDGRDVVLSLNGKRRTPIYIGVYRWIAAANAYLELRKSKHAGRIIPVYYEEMVRNPADYLEILCSLLDEKFYPGMLDFWKDESAGEDGQLKYGTSPISDESVGTWEKADYDRTILTQINIAIKPQMRELGYEIE